MDASLVGKRVSVVTADGQHIVGTLTGMDQFLNLCFADATAIVYSPSGDAGGGDDDGAYPAGPPEESPLGGFVLRGDEVACIGLVNTVLEAALDRTDHRFDGFTGQSAATAAPVA